MKKIMIITGIINLILAVVSFLLFIIWGGSTYTWEKDLLFGFAGYLPYSWPEAHSTFFRPFAFIKLKKPIRNKGSARAH